MGNGLKTRAILRIGALTLISNENENGIAVSIVNEKSEVCKSEITGIFVENKQYLVDKNGEILLPFSEKNTTNYKSLIFSDNYSEISDLTIPSQNFV